MKTEEDIKNQIDEMEGWENKSEYNRGFSERTQMGVEEKGGLC